MKCQNLINLLGNTPNQPTKFRTKNWAEINDDAPGMYNINSQVKFKNQIVKSSVCDYSDAYILVKGTISTAPVSPPAADPCEINNTYIDNAKYINVVMSMYNLIEYSINYSKASGSMC